MLLRSSSTPALKNLVGGNCCVVSEIEGSPSSHVSPKYSPIRNPAAAVSLKRTSSEGDLKLLPSKKAGKSSKQQSKDGSSPLRPPSRTALLQRATSEGDLKLIPKGGISSIEEAARSVVESAGGGRGGGRGDEVGFSSGGRGEDRIWGMRPQGTEFMDKYYRDMITMYPGDGLLLANYAKFLKEARGDAERAEEYCERAILVDAADGGVLSMYGDLIWNNHKDGDRANTYFNQACKSAPGDCHVLASYARFLWDVAEEGEEEEEEEAQQLHQPLSRPQSQAQYPAHSFGIGFGAPLGFPPLTA